MEYTQHILTPRLSLNAIASDDLEAVISILRAPEVTQTYMVPALDDVGMDKLAKRFAELSKDSQHFVRGIFWDNLLVGLINDTEISETGIELGWAIHPAYHNRGVATEAVTAAIVCLLDAGVSEVTAGAFEENKASIRVMEKAGMLRIPKTDEVEYRGKLHKCIYYSCRKYPL